MRSIVPSCTKALLTASFMFGVALIDAPVGFAKNPSAGTAPFSAPNPLPSVLLMILGLGIVLFLAYFLIRFLGMKTQIRNQGPIDIVAVRQVGQNRSIQVIEVSGHRYLIGVGEQVTLLAELTHDLLDEMDLPKAEATRPFGGMLADALNRARSKYGPVQRGEQET